MKSKYWKEKEGESELQKFVERKTKFFLCIRSQGKGDLPVQNFCDKEYKCIWQLYYNLY